MHPRWRTKPRWPAVPTGLLLETCISRSEIKLMVQLLAIMGAVLTSVTIAALTSFSLVALIFAVMAVALLVAFGIIITRDS